MRKLEKKLTPKQQLFIKEYLIDKNATQACIRAGYSKKTANEQGARLLADVSIRALVDKELSNLKQKTELTAEWVLNNLKELAERCMQQIPVYDKNGEETGEWRFDSAGANRSLELIGKHLSMFTEKVESKNTNVNTELDIKNMSDEEIERELNKLGFKK